jgi:hypothetical protein
MIVVCGIDLSDNYLVGKRAAISHQLSVAAEPKLNKDGK